MTSTNKRKPDRTGLSRSTLVIASLVAAGVFVSYFSTSITATPLPPSIDPLSYHPSGIPGMVRIKDKGYVLTTAEWRSPDIPVCWEATPPETSTERGWVRDAIAKSWEAHSAVNFYPVVWPTCAANAKGIRIAVSDEGPHTLGLGTQIDNKPNGMVLNFTFKNWGEDCAAPNRREKCIRSIAVHEFGHALALAHEQNRPETPGECTKKPQGSNGDVMLTPWDLHSVMNYCNPVYNNEGVLSEGDIISVVKIYGRK